MSPPRQVPPADTIFNEDQALAAAARLLAQRGIFGAVWLDHAMVARHTLGSLAAGVVIGEPITESLLALVGQEDAIEALKAAPDQLVAVTNISLLSGVDLTPNTRMNISLYWQQLTQTYLVVMDRVIASNVAETALENEIKQRRIRDEDLARVNLQLEEFAYVISHDLKAPLRALRYYSGDITEALATDEPDIEAAKTAAQNVMTATRRMSNMLVGLLEYSRISRQHEAIEQVETGKLAHEIVASLAIPDEMQVTVEGDWPELRSALVPLDLVLRNLIDNAIKHHDRDTGHIRVWCEVAETYVVFVVADDGPGIDPEWQQAIFQPFSRIDDSRNPESSGIGLALVKRTLESAGGRIEVRSDPSVSRGTQFRVTWPKR